MDFPSHKHPFTAILAGLSKVGKSHFVKEFIRFNADMMNPVENCMVLWDPPKFIQRNSWRHLRGRFPSRRRIIFRNQYIVYYRWFKSKCDNDKRLTNFFTRGSHHLNLSVIFIMQFFFHKGREMLDFWVNVDYIFLFKNRRDLSQITHLGNNYICENWKFSKK